MTREKLGKRLKEIRQEKGVTTYDMERKKVRFEVIQSIEKGDKNYTILSLLKYMTSAGIRFKDIGL
jgi:transcriptional regulator with XRE-family HTH domain